MAHKNQYPPPVQQKALPVILLKIVAKKKVTKLQRAVARLMIEAFFLPVDHANCVSITFDWQKKDTRQDTVTQLRTRDLVLCPFLRQWAAIV
eukprot:8145256-Ditylum_brightwellii.AAC.1